jgi:hypothetical protein
MIERTKQRTKGTKTERKKENEKQQNHVSKKETKKERKCTIPALKLRQEDGFGYSLQNLEPVTYFCSFELVFRCIMSIFKA